MQQEKKRSHEMPHRKNPAAARNAAHSAPHAASGTAPAADYQPGADKPTAAILAALTANPGGVTTADVAGFAWISRTAAARALAELEAAGAAERTKGGRPGIADTWRLATGPTGVASPSADGANAAGEPGPAAESARDREPGQDQAPASGQLPASLGSGEQTGPGGQDAIRESQHDDTGPGDVDGQQAGDVGRGEDASPDTAMAAEMAGHAARIGFTAQAATTALQAGDLAAALAAVEDIHDQAGQARRALKAAVNGKKAPAAKPGALRDLVAAHLREHPGTTFTPHQIGKKLNRSSGAVANALDRLVSLGTAELAAEKPRSFRLVPGAAAPPADGQDGATRDGEDSAAGSGGEPGAGAA
jgi:predicted transcriptional regulator